MLLNVKRFVSHFFVYIFEEIVDSGKIERVPRKEPTLKKESTPSVDETGIPTIFLD